MSGTFSVKCPEGYRWGTKKDFQCFESEPAATFSTRSDQKISHDFFISRMTFFSSSIFCRFIKNKIFFNNMFFWFWDDLDKKSFVLIRTEKKSVSVKKLKPIRTSRFSGFKFGHYPVSAGTRATESWDQETGPDPIKNSRMIYSSLKVDFQQSSSVLKLGPWW